MSQMTGYAKQLRGKVMLSNGRQEIGGEKRLRPRKEVGCGDRGVVCYGKTWKRV